MSRKERKVHGTPWRRRRVPHIWELEKRTLYRKARTLGKRHNFDLKHSAQVCRLSLALFDELRRLHGLKARDRELLMVAALLHDIGSHRRMGGRAKGTTGHEHPHHHKRSQRIILKKGVSGLKDKEALIVSCVARYHTKGLPQKGHEHYRDLGHTDRKRVRRMAALMRIADSLDRRHASMVKDLRCVASKDGKEETIWVFCKKHAFDWRPKHRTDLFERELGLKVRIQVLFGTAVG